MSDEAVRAKTGRNWQQWFSILDKAGSKKMSHKEIAEYLYERRGVPGWWSQMVTVTYEQDRGCGKGTRGRTATLSAQAGRMVSQSAFSTNNEVMKNLGSGGSRTS